MSKTLRCGTLAPKTIELAAKAIAEEANKVMDEAGCLLPPELAVAIALQRDMARWDRFVKRLERKKAWQGPNS